MARVVELGIGVDEEPPTSGRNEYRLSATEVHKGIGGKNWYYGTVSPACIDCRTGACSKTVFHTLACNRDCFFCANRNQAEYGHFTKSVNDAEKELEQADSGSGYTSLALTGGEPLLFPEKALSFFQFAAERYPGAHKRLYTNGDLLTDERAAQLAEAGLNEIRISVKIDAGGEAAMASTLEKLSLAKRHIPSVLVEMPVIPGTVETMKRLFLSLEDRGIDGINILEFLYPWTNGADYAAQGHKLKKKPYRVLYSYNYAGGLPIAGSEDACFELLEFAAAKRLKLNVHYCSLENKLTAQIYHQNATARLMPHEVLSDKDFFIKIARAYNTNAKKVKKYLDKVAPGSYQLAGDYLEFHPRHISGLTGIDEIALTCNVVERTNNGSQMREIKIDLVTPATFDYASDI
ncbi:radical SAM protein [Geobacter sp. FeAm09]|uniref:radical SAM protein n=1 Tax=Geobacter sp. FeAm09 TaxID=2597769 RepID=UPI00143D3A67|nr:radical SAM protein [Geobacter sp. FeAm09]